jgi:hypothetical protein
MITYQDASNNEVEMQVTAYGLPWEELRDYLREIMPTCKIPDKVVGTALGSRLARGTLTPYSGVQIRHVPYNSAEKAKKGESISWAFQGWHSDVDELLG